MEQLFSAFGLDWRLLLIQAFNFGILLTVLTYFLYKPILKMIDERREKIAEGVRTADAAARRLAEAQEQGETMVGDAAREAEGLVSSARTRADEKHAAIVAEAESRAHGIIKDAEAKAREAERQALIESEREIAKAAMLAAEKILKQKSA
jgi:F-type H+-transporting ATPase subunit b